MRYDFHTHSFISKDSDATIIQMVMQAREQNMDGICFTEHIDPYFPDEFEPFCVDWEKYDREIAKPRMALPEMEIFQGIEAGLNKNSWEEIDKQIKEHPNLDFVLGSMHCTNEMTIAEDDYYYRYEKRKIQTDYLECLIENIKGFDNFDCVAHIGFLAKFAPEAGWDIHFEDFRDLVDELLTTVINKGKGIELNTSSLKRGEFTMPARDILKRYKELGGEILTLGSDAHSPEWIGYEFDFATVVILKYGFEYLTKFSKRKPIFYEI